MKQDGLLQGSQGQAQSQSQGEVEGSQRHGSQRQGPQGVQIPRTQGSHGQVSQEAHGWASWFECSRG